MSEVRGIGAGQLSRGSSQQNRQELLNKLCSGSYSIEVRTEAARKLAALDKKDVVDYLFVLVNKRTFAGINYVNTPATRRAAMAVLTYIMEYTSQTGKAEKIQNLAVEIASKRYEWKNEDAEVIKQCLVAISRCSPKISSPILNSLKDKYLVCNKEGIYPCLTQMLLKLSYSGYERVLRIRKDPAARAEAKKALASMLDHYGLRPGESLQNYTPDYVNLPASKPACQKLPYKTMMMLYSSLRIAGYCERSSPSATEEYTRRDFSVAADNFQKANGIIGGQDGNKIGEGTINRLMTYLKLITED